MKTWAQHRSGLRFAAALALTVSTAAVVSTAAAGPAGGGSPAAASQDIRDIRGPKPVPAPWVWAWWVGSGAVLAIAIYGAWRHWAGRPASGLQPYQIALARLEESRKWMQSEDAHEFSVEVSEIVRTYIAVRFEMRADHRTTEEFLHDLLAMPEAILGSHRALLAEFLRHCDLAKFARWVLSYPEMEQVLLSAMDFVLATGHPQLELRPERLAALVPPAAAP